MSRKQHRRQPSGTTDRLDARRPITRSLNDPDESMPHASTKSRAAALSQHDDERAIQHQYTLISAVEQAAYRLEAYEEQGGRVARPDPSRLAELHGELRRSGDQLRAFQALHPELCSV